MRVSQSAGGGLVCGEAPGVARTPIGPPLCPKEIGRLVTHAHPPPIRPRQPPGRRQPGDAYTARHLSVLEGLEAVRKRPGMYIGSTDSRGLQHCLWEIIDNAVDEALGGHCTAIEVCCTPTARPRSATTAAASRSTSSARPG